MKKYLVAAHFEVEEGSFERFVEEAEKVAHASVREEPGCERYDVLVSRSGGPQGTLYEIYAQKSDHDAHKKMPYFLNFWIAIADLRVKWVVEHGELSLRNEFTSPR